MKPLLEPQEKKLNIFEIVQTIVRPMRAALIRQLKSNKHYVETIRIMIGYQQPAYCNARGTRLGRQRSVEPYVTDL